MKTITFLFLTLCTAASVRADFSYTTSRKGASPGAAAGPADTKHYFKGQKMLTDNGTTATLVDFDAQTITNIDKAQKTFTPIKFTELPDVLKQSDIEVKAEVKETGQKKVINGFNATETVITMALDSPQISQAGMKMQMEVSSWISSDVPGAQEVKAFFQRNAASFPWAAMGGGAMQKGMTDIQRKMAASGGVALLQIVKVKSAGDGAQAVQMQAGMAQARAQMEALVKQGGPGAAAAQQALARMGAPAAGGALMEITTESTGFSTASIPDAVFAIPADCRRK